MEVKELDGGEGGEVEMKAEKWRCRNKMEGKHNIEVKAER